MASTYFTLPSFARAKQNKEQLEKTNPQKPVLNDEDQRWLERQITPENAPSSKPQDETPVEIADDGREKELSKDQQDVGTAADQVVVPEHRPDESKQPNPQTTERNTEQRREGKKRSSGIELPSQEEAEAATRNFNFNPGSSGSKGDQGDKGPDGKRTWASYLPSIGSTTKKTATEGEETGAEASGDQPMQRSWTELASSYIPASWKPKDKDSTAEPVYNEDGTINEEETKKKEEREVSVLLDNLNMSTINNRVFSFSEDTHKIYERFAQCLRDTMNGAPTAYDDMDKLMREAGPTLENQFKSMPPFVQTLVKSLPAKLSASLGPEFLAAASEKPGADLKARMEADSKLSAGSAKPVDSKTQPKKKRKVPGLKSLVSQEGAVAGILRNVVNFLRVRFPFLASTTNVVMSLAVFILMFVFWYCHKRGKEVRLAKEADASRTQSEAEDQEEDSSNGEDHEDDTDADGQEKADKRNADMKADILKQPDPSQVPLPAKEDADLGSTTT